jgi:alpha-mannosidase
LNNTYRHHIRFTAEKIGKRLPLVAGYIRSAHHPIDIEIADRSPGDTNPTNAAKCSNWQPIKSGDQWGGFDQYRWLRASFQIPHAWQGQKVAAHIVLSNADYDVHAEAIAFLNGEARQGIDPNHHEMLLTESAQGGEGYDLVLAAWTTYFGHYFDRPVPNPDTAAFQVAELVCIHTETRKFYHLAEVALGATRRISADSLDYHQILNALDESFKLLDYQSAEHFYKSLPAAMQTLQTGLAQIPPSRAKVLATGHAHIDVEWMWRLMNTREKSQHTFSTVLRLMEQYPDYHFTQSQAQLYALLKEDAPHLFAQIRERAREGRWEVTGGMWVEPDMNLISGESIIRQIMYGRKFFREEVGEDTPILWLPDTFGYSWALPQIIKRSGLKYFMTSKISWNQYNRIPYDSFRWRGIDGTEVVTHFLTAASSDDGFFATYNAMVTPEETEITFKHYQQKDVHDEVLTTFGHGDGGGGPMLEMLERLDVMKHAPALPHVKQGRAIEFFDRLNAKADKLPVWNAELYFEYHRGTYTSQARNKRNNRKAEVLYHRAEFIAAMATLVGQPYPHDLLREGWHLLLLNQFHDIIPGSSIRAVYEDSEKDYARIFEIGEQVIAESIKAITPHLPLKKGERGIVVLRSAGVVHDEEDILTIPAGWLKQHKASGDDSLEAIQHEADHTYISVYQQSYMASSEIKLLGDPDNWQTEIPIVDELIEAATVTATSNTLENHRLRVEFNELGEITSLYDKRVKLELIPSGVVGNQLQAFEDRPMNWDAWDIDTFYDDKMFTAQPVSARIIEKGPLCAMLEFRKRILHSDVVQRVSLKAHSNRLDFDTTIDWRERHTLLKVAFPVNLLSPYATFDIQFGNVQRPTHRNTSWDWARFESVGHKWANLSETGYSVSLLNDCKYGYDVHDHVLRLSLLRAPTKPDAEADQGSHEFTYSLLADPVDIIGETIRQGYLLNDPAEVFLVEGVDSDDKLGLDALMIYVDRTFMTSIIIETVKAAENSEGLIVRLYETIRSRGDAYVCFGFPIRAAWETNLLEENERELTIERSSSHNSIQLTFTPFQIRTIRVIPA